MITRNDLAYPGFVMSGIETIFRDTFQNASLSTQWTQIATKVETSLPIQKYPFLGAPPHMKKLRDRMDDQGVNPYLVTIEDEEWEANMRIGAKALEDDATGMYDLQAQAMGEAAARFLDEQSFTKLDAGFTGLCYDGQPFYNANHASGASGTQSNTTSAALSANSLAAAVGTMGTFLDDAGRPFGSVPSVLAVGPLLQMRAFELIESPVVVVKPGDGTAGSGATSATGYSNVLQGRFSVVVDPWISGYHWHLLDTRRVVKPIIIQDRMDIGVQTWDDRNDPQARRKREYNFTAFRRTGFGYGPWQTGFGSNASA